MIRIGAQALFAAAVIAAVLYLRRNLVTNMQTLGIQTDFGFLDAPTRFRILGSNFRSSQPIRDAIGVGLTNTILVSAVGIVLATILGVVVGVARLSTNWLVRRAASLYVEALRNVPLLVVILFWSTAVILKLPRLDAAPVYLDSVIVSNRGIWVPWFVGEPGLGMWWVILLAGIATAIGLGWWRTRRFDATGTPHHRVAFGAAVVLVVAAAGYAVLGGPFSFSVPSKVGLGVDGGIAVGKEYGALLAGLVVYTASHIAEIVRGSIQSVERGQSEAATALGLSRFQRLRFVVLPQALRIMVPPMANQYLNLTKNSSLAVAVGYADLMFVTSVVIGNGNPAPQSLAIVMLIYLGLSLSIAAATNLFNRRLQVATR